jgi:hypothetical protein
LFVQSVQQQREKDFRLRKTSSSARRGSMRRGSDNPGGAAEVSGATAFPLLSRVHERPPHRSALRSRPPAPVTERQVQ